MRSASGNPFLLFISTQARAMAALARKSCLALYLAAAALLAAPPPAAGQAPAGDGCNPTAESLRLNERSAALAASFAEETRDILMTADPVERLLEHLALISAQHDRRVRGSAELRGLMEDHELVFLADAEMLRRRAAQAGHSEYRYIPEQTLARRARLWFERAEPACARADLEKALAAPTGPATTAYQWNGRGLAYQYRGSINLELGEYDAAAADFGSAADAAQSAARAEPMAGLIPRVRDEAQVNTARRREMRAIALMMAGRHAEAAHSFAEASENRLVLWIYIAQRRAGLPAAEAQAALRANMRPAFLVEGLGARYMLGEINEATLLERARLLKDLNGGPAPAGQTRCTLRLYIAQRALIDGTRLAAAALRQARTDCPAETIENALVAVELARLPP